jgi:hypothetical protein
MGKSPLSHDFQAGKKLLGVPGTKVAHFEP